MVVETAEFSFGGPSLSHSHKKFPKGIVGTGINDAGYVNAIWRVIVCTQATPDW